MSTAETVLTTIVTSTLVAGLVGAATGYYFNRRLETVKAELELTTHAARAIADQKLEVFPRIVELIYRIRNLAREAVSGNVTPDLVRELRVRVASLENDLYEFRMLLEKEEVFHPIHSFKNELKAFNQFVLDLQAHGGDATGNVAEQESLVAEIRGLYDRIEVRHAEIIRTLALLTGPAGRG